MESQHQIQVGQNNTMTIKHVYPSIKTQLDEIPWESIPPKVYQNGLNITINIYNGGSARSAEGPTPERTSEDAKSSSTEEASSPESFEGGESNIKRRPRRKCQKGRMGVRKRGKTK